MSSIIKPTLGSQLQIGHRLACGLVGCWPFNEGSGGQVFDLSGNGNTGTFVGSTSWTSGKFGSALDFPGAGSYVLAPINNRVTYPFTYGIHFRQNIAADTDIISFANTGSDEDFSYVMLNENAGEVWIRHGLRNSGANLYEQYAVDIGTDVNIHLVVVHNSATSSDIYLNGKFWFNNPDNVALDLPNFNRIGFAIRADSTPSSSAFDGQANFAFLYNRALSASEIALLYREPFCMFERELIELWVGSVGAGGNPWNYYAQCA